MSESVHRTEVAIVGGGIASITAALELLEHDREVCLLDCDRRNQFGGIHGLSIAGGYFPRSRS